MNTARTPGSSRHALRLRLRNEEQTVALGKKLGACLPAGTIVALDGTLGAGKTRLVRAVAEAIGISPTDVTSPTFTLWQTYQGNHTVHHLDAYRIGDVDEFLDLGVDECFSTQAITFIEWADRVKAALPPERLEISIDTLDHEQREIEIAATSPRLHKIVDTLANAFQDSSPNESS